MEREQEVELAEQFGYASYLSIPPIQLLPLRFADGVLSGNFSFRESCWLESGVVKVWQFHIDNQHQGHLS